MTSETTTTENPNEVVGQRVNLDKQLQAVHRFTVAFQNNEVMHMNDEGAEALQGLLDSYEELIQFYRTINQLATQPPA